MSAYPTGLTQEEMMLRDNVIVVDDSDKILGFASKQDSHTVNQSQPRGQLHRAFSVFLFNSSGKLLLQQRAGCKITFPNVWTNTCCSHPLSGCTPNEIDNDEDIHNGTVPGVKNAAIRKLNHELGIPLDAVQVDDFKYLTRLHYFALDTVTHGPNSPWCEHEIDFILFLQKDVEIQPNAEEIGDVRYVDLAELEAMMNPASGLLWSPWFRIIKEKFLVHWWADLPTTLRTNIFTNFTTVYTFDNDKKDLIEVTANNVYTVGQADKVKDENLKQGAYGKVKIHKHSLLSQLSHVDEVIAGIYYLISDKLKSKLDITHEDIYFCNDILGKVSRSFAGVIRELPQDLYLDILVFYLVLRALDTVEDDMEVFRTEKKLKEQYLCEFYRTVLVTQSDKYRLWSIGQGDERTLLQHFNHCVKVFKSLPPPSRIIIADITERMGAGMASFVNRDLGQGTVTIEDYNLYCHYVAGLVGEGLSELFYAGGYESAKVRDVSKTKANTMGLFLQKTNIIRDYLEDFCEGRTFWPQEIWKLYADDLGDFREPKNKKKALHCLNHMILNALECIPECLEYMELLHHKQIFLFCAIPQVMAIATLAEIYNNHKVFTGVVKIRKGMAVLLIQDVGDLSNLYKWFYLLTRDIYARIPNDDPNAERTREICRKVLQITGSKGKFGFYRSFVKKTAKLGAILVAVSSYYLAPHVIDKKGTFHWDVFTLRHLEEYSTNVVVAVYTFYAFLFIILLSAVLETVSGWRK
eukprot:scaffold1498_cov180-Ochromonas_danica.AAC.17